MLRAHATTAPRTYIRNCAIQIGHISHKLTIYHVYMFLTCHIRRGVGAAAAKKPMKLGGATKLAASAADDWEDWWNSPFFRFVRFKLFFVVSRNSTTKRAWQNKLSGPSCKRALPTWIRNLSVFAYTINGLSRPLFISCISSQAFSAPLPVCSLILCCWESRTCPRERWGAGVETQKNVRGEIGGRGRVPFNETYAPSLSTIYDGA